MRDPPTQSALETNPHLAQYIFKLVLSNAQLTAAAAAGTSGRHMSGQHPLSVSSSGESDDEDENDADEERFQHSSNDDASSADEDGSTSGSSNQDKSSNGHRRPPPLPLGPSREEREELVRKVIDLLDNEQEEDVKDLLRTHMGEMGNVSFYQ